MSPPLWVVEAAASFWREAGEPDRFPRDIRRAIARTSPIAIVSLSRLHVARANEWFRQQHVSVDISVNDRPLRACLIAQSGSGIILVDGSDSEEEQRFSIAHELSHFLHDYCAPRQAAVALQGAAILEVLDGLRPAGINERTVGLLGRAPVRAHVHLMGRWEDVHNPVDVDASESAADTLARELLAPWAVVADDVIELGIAHDREAIAAGLIERYGLPMKPAIQYAELLCSEKPSPSPLLRYIRRSL